MTHNLVNVSLLMCMCLVVAVQASGNAANTSIAAKGFKQGLLQAVATDPTVGCLRAIDRNSRYPMRMVITAGLAACRQACANDAVCQLVVFNTANNNCWLKASWVPLQPDLASTDTTYSCPNPAYTPAEQLQGRTVRFVNLRHNAFLYVQRIDGILHTWGNWDDPNGHFRLLAGNQVGRTYPVHSLTQRGLYIDSDHSCVKSYPFWADPNMNFELIAVPSRGANVVALRHVLTGLLVGLTSAPYQDGAQAVPTQAALDNIPDYALWTIVEVVPVRYQFSDVQYHLDQDAINQAQPQGMYHVRVKNGATVPQHMSMTPSVSYTTEKSWSIDAGMTTGVTVEGSCGIPLLAEGSVSVSVEVSVNYHQGETITTTKTYSFTVDVDVPALTTMDVLVTGRQTTLDVPFTSTVVYVYDDGNKLTFPNKAGVFRGVDVQDINIVYTPLPYVQDAKPKLAAAAANSAAGTGVPALEVEVIPVAPWPKVPAPTLTPSHN